VPLVVVWLAVFPVIADAAGLQVFDAVTVAGEAATVRVFTGTGPFPAGGERVWIRVAEEPETEILTGGDGYGYRRIRPERSGLMTVRARTRQSGAEGRVLVLGRGERPVLVEIETGLPLPKSIGEARAATRDALSRISDAHPLVYWSRRMGLAPGRAWIRFNDYPEAPMLTGSPHGLAERMEAVGVRWKAVVGGDELLEAVAHITENAFAFRETRFGRRMDSWQAVREALQP
jgi:hypothetical protein